MDVDGLRVRILAVMDGDQKAQAVVASAEEAAAVVGIWLADLVEDRALSDVSAVEGTP